MNRSKSAPPWSRATVGVDKDRTVQFLWCRQEHAQALDEGEMNPFLLVLFHFLRNVWGEIP